MSAELNSAAAPGPAASGAVPSGAVPPEAVPGAGGPADGERPAEPGPPAAAEPAEPGEAPLAELSAAVRQAADLSRRYHARAEQREAVIDFLRSELETLRRGERRGLLRPVLAEMCRLREDLISQAASLPADFDAAKAAGLLRSYAETL